MVVDPAYLNTVSNKTESVETAMSEEESVRYLSFLQEKKTRRRNSTGKKKKDFNDDSMCKYKFKHFLNVNFNEIFPCVNKIKMCIFSCYKKT